MESRVLPSAEIARLLAANAVCIKTNVDSPSGDVAKYVEQVSGRVLPFYAYVSPDGKFIQGTSGYRDEETFKQDLVKALRSDAMRAPPEVEKKLAQALAQAEKDLEAKKYAAVIRVAKESEKTRGFSDAKQKLQDLRAQAEEAGKQALTEAAALAGEGKFDEALAAARKLQADFKGTEIETAAGVAVKSSERLKAAAGHAEKGDKANAKHVYQLILKEAPGTPYAALAEEKLKGLE